RGECRRCASRRPGNSAPRSNRRSPVRDPSCSTWSWKAAPTPSASAILAVSRKRRANVSTPGPLTEEGIKKFVAAWYYALDIHAPIEECNRLLTEEGLNVQFPDGDIRDLAGFKKWYDRVTNLFFDE